MVVLRLHGAQLRDDRFGRRRMWVGDALGVKTQAGDVENTSPGKLF